MATRRVSLPDDLDALAREHASRLPSPSSLIADGFRRALQRLGVAVPPKPEKGQTSAATEAARRARIGADENS